MTTLEIDERVFERLHVLSGRMGRPPEAILDQALIDFEQKVESEIQPQVEPKAEVEAEILDDIGPIRLPPRDLRVIHVRIEQVGRLPPEFQLRRIDR